MSSSNNSNNPLSALATGLVVLSYGLGWDSTAILLRWLTEPSSRQAG